LLRHKLREVPVSFFILAAVFAVFILFLYGPMIVIFILSFQGPEGGLTFPMRGASLKWFMALWEQERIGDAAGSFIRSFILSLLVMVLTTVVSVAAGLGFRRRFLGDRALFYFIVACLVMPGVLVSFGIGLICQIIDLQPQWYTTALGAQLTWTLPFGLFIIFAVLGRFDRSLEEAARDLGATNWQTLRHVLIPILMPGIIGAAMFGFTLSYDEIPRTMFSSGSSNTLPLEILALTNTETSPALYAIGTLTTCVSFLVIALALAAIVMIQRRRAGKPIGSKNFLRKGDQSAAIR
jgi:putative spermidine/putrescine transport system permease protein